MNAADLPEGSIVATGYNVWLKGAEDSWYRTTSDDSFCDFDIQGELDAGAKVLRVGRDG